MLKIKNLKVKYGKNKILSGFNLDISKGEILSVVGESGTGKTTLAMTLMGLCEGEIDGKIYFKENNILKFSEEQKRDLRLNNFSMVFQDIARSLNPVMTVMKQIMEPLLENKSCNLIEAKKRSQKLLKDVGIKKDCDNIYPHQLSGGEKQRVLIAMALANNPEILILDEPTSALDTVTKLEILALLKKISIGRTVIIVTHDIATAAKLSTKTAVMYAGKIVELGKTKDIIKNPRHPYTRGLLRSYPNMTTTKDLMGIPGKKEASYNGCPFSSRCTQSIKKCSSKEPELIEQNGRLIACHRGGIVTLLEAEDIVKYYDKNKVLNEVSFKLDEGETLAVVGESGSGKTTLAKCIMGLEKNEKGKFIFQGSAVNKRKKDFYKDVQMIFQNPHECVSHRLNVLEAVVEPLEVQKYGSKQERIDAAKKVLEEVELPTDEEFLTRYAHHLSGGEIQRLAVARALILKPKLLIADEPTSALDASVQAKIIKLLLNLQEKRGLSMLFITHDIALARKLSDRVAVMLSGHIVESGPTSEVFAQPKHPYTADLLRAAPDFSFEIEEPDTVDKNIQGACPYASRCPRASNICYAYEPKTIDENFRKVKCHLYGSQALEIRKAL